MKKDKPKLLVIAETSQAVSEIIEILYPNFAIRLLSPNKVNCADVEDLAYCLCVASLTKINTSVFNCIKSNVTSGKGVFFILEPGFIGSDSIEFFSFVRAKAVRETDVSPLKLHIFPHYLTRGISEIVEINKAVKVELEFLNGFSKISDNVFIEDMESNPLAYEHVYKGNGRVIILAIQSLGVLSELEKGVFSNLHLLQNITVNVEHSFSQEISQEIPFRKNVLMEIQGDVCRWNTLFNDDKTDIIYTHSTVFLPGSPEFCKERLRGWSKQHDKGYTKERLEQSFMGVEIRNTDFCPQNCYYCYNRRDRDVKYTRTFLSENQHILLEKDLLKMKEIIGHNFFIRYTGPGEPLNHPRTLPSLLKFEQAGISTALITNGELLSADNASVLGSNGTYVRFSVDASNAQSYAAIRQCGTDVFNKIINNIAQITKSKCFVGATFLVCKENYKQIFDFCNLMKSLGVNTVWIRPTDGCDKFLIDEIGQIEEDMARALTLIDENFFVMVNQFKISHNIPLRTYKNDIIRCWSGHTKAFIQPTGDVIICLSRPDFIIGNIKEQSFSQIWGGERHLQFFKDNYLTSCSQCVESRYNNSADYLVRNNDKIIYKGTRVLETSM